MCISDHLTGKILKCNIVLHILSDLREVLHYGWSKSSCGSSEVLTLRIVPNVEFRFLFLKHYTFQLHNMQCKKGLVIGGMLCCSKKHD